MYNLLNQSTQIYAFSKIHFKNIVINVTKSKKYFEKDPKEKWIYNIRDQEKRFL